MTCTISSELELRLAAEAAQRRTTVDRLVEAAIRNYLEKGAASQFDAPSPLACDKDEWLRTFRELQRSLGVTEEAAQMWQETIKDGRR